MIDIAGFTSLDEKTIWQAINSTGVNYEEWTIQKEYAEDKSILHLYIELKQEINSVDLAYLKPPHINQRNAMIETLLRLGIIT